MKGDVFDSNLVVKTDYRFKLCRSYYHILCHSNILHIYFFCKKSCSVVRKKNPTYKEESWSSSWHAS